MTDQNVLRAQTYLNNMYGHRDEWIELAEDGITGTATCQGIIRAFQIENNVSPVTGNVGDLTLSKMRSLENISKMEANDEPNRNVCILQCALFAKGYNAGGVTGIYYTTGVNAVKQFQDDANLEETGVIDWKVWMGLVSLNWFKKINDGDDNIVQIQRQLNADWSDIIGVGPCDGVVSRFTAYALIAALQAAEGIYSDFIGSLDGTNFGNQTTENFPTVLKQGQNGSYIKYNKLVQYGLYLNGYDPGRFDGIFDSTTKSQVEDFQQFYALTGINLVTLGEVNCATMKSLLTSKGDTSRTARACDCSTVLNSQQALDLKSAGYQVVGRYLTGTVGGTTRKFLTFEEIDNIENAGLKVFPIYQDGGYELEYFQDLRQGIVDGHIAISAAKRIGVPNGTVIYFAVDFDCYSYQMESFIVPYFKRLDLVFKSSINSKNYKVGIYAPRYVCSYISDMNLAEYSFVADMSSGYSCNLGYPIPENWAFDQFYELKGNEKFSSNPSFDLDKVAYSGRDTGIASFDEVTYLTPDQLAQQNSNIMNDIVSDQFVYNVLEALDYLTAVSNASLTYNEEFSLDTIVLNGLTVEVTANISQTYTSDEEFSEPPITIDLDNTGKLTASCEASIDGLIGSVELEDFDGIDIINSKLEDLKNVAVSITSGKIGIKTDFNSEYPKLTFVITSDDIFSDSDTVNLAITIEISFKLIPIPEPEYNYEIDPDVLVAGVKIAAVVGLFLLMSTPGGQGFVVQYLIAIGAMSPSLAGV